MGTTHLKYAEAAKKFGVTPRELRTFTRTNPRTLRTNFNRSPAYTKLYREGERKEVRESLKIRRIKKYKFRTRDIESLRSIPGLPEYEKRNREQIGKLIRGLYARGDLPRIQADWVEYTREHDLPTSITTIKLLHRNGTISDDEFEITVATWRDVYNISDSRFAAVFGMENAA